MKDGSTKRQQRYVIAAYVERPPIQAQCRHCSNRRNAFTILYKVACYMPSLPIYYIHDTNSIVLYTN